MYLDSYSVYLHLFTVHKLQTYSLPKMCRFLPTYNFYSKDFWYKFKTGKIISCSTWVKLSYRMAKKSEWTTIQDPQPPQKCKIYDNLKTKILAKGLSLEASLISWKCKIASRFNCWSVFDFLFILDTIMESSLSSGWKHCLFVCLFWAVVRVAS